MNAAGHTLGRSAPLAHGLCQADALLAWVLLGWLGQRLGWSYASGVLPVVLWWTVRALGRTGGQRALGSSTGGMLAVAALAALAWWVPAHHGALLLLLTGSLAWGVWSARLATTGAAQAPASLPAQAMGFMMGSLWLTPSGCLNPGWSGAESVTLHLALMAGIPGLLTALRRTSLCLWLRPRPGPASRCLALLAAGALLMAWQDQTAGRLAGMVLVVLAWSLAAADGCGDPAQPARRTNPAAPGPTALFGPALLLLMGLMAPRLGPAAAQAAWSLFGLLALLGLLLCLRPPVPRD